MHQNPKPASEAEHLYQGGTDATIESPEAGLSSLSGPGGSGFRGLGFKVMAWGFYGN